MHASLFNTRSLAFRSVAVSLAAGLVVGASGGAAFGDLVYQSQSRYVMYEIECGDQYDSTFLDDAVAAADYSPFDASLNLNVEWPSKMWPDVEGRAGVGQGSSLAGTLILAAGEAHVHAYVQEDQTRAYADAACESYFYVEFKLTAPTIIDLSGAADWQRSTVDPPRHASVSAALRRDGETIFSHAREYNNPGGVVQDDGEAFAFAEAAAAGMYELEIAARTEARSQGPWRQYAEATSSFDAALVITPTGDLDGDCDVDLGDLAQLLSGYGTTEGASYVDGDLDWDGDVDLSDLAALLSVYGAACD